jgi:hypothetical protein
MRSRPLFLQARCCYVAYFRVAPPRGTVPKGRAGEQYRFPQRKRMPGRERGRHREGRGRGTQGGPSGVGTPAAGIQGSWIRACHRARTTRRSRDDERYARSDAIREVNGRRPAQTGRRFFFLLCSIVHFFDDRIAVADRRRSFVRFVTARECYLLDADCIRTERQPASKRGDAGTATSRSRHGARTLGAAAAGNTYRQR